MTTRLIILSALLLCAGGISRAADSPLGVFTDHSNVGTATAAGAGSAQYDPAKQTYAISGTGANVWLNADAFHFVWKKVPAGNDLSLAATIEFAAGATGSDPHRKAFLMIRQSLDADSAYADACVHGNGLTAIQWRDTKGDPTYETQAQVNAPRRLRIEKRGDYLSVSFGSSDKDLQPAGGACKVQFTGDVYVGIGVCAHRAARIEKAVFSNVAISDIPAPTSSRTEMISTLETIQLSSKDRRAVYVLTQPGLQRAEAPNWSADNMLYFNNRGKLFKIKADVPAGARRPPLRPLPRPSTWVRSRTSTMTTGSRPTESCWPSATNPRPTGIRRSGCFQSEGPARTPRPQTPHRQHAVLLPWLVAGWQNHRLLRPAE